MDIISRKKARKLGLQTYYTGKLCKKNHYSSRLVSNGVCLSCMSEYREKNSDLLKKQDKKRYEKNKNKILSQHKQHYITNKGIRKEYNKMRYQRDKEYFQIYNKEYRKNNFALIANSKAKRRAIERKSIPKWYDDDLMRNVFVQRNIIRESTGIDHEADHIVPLISPYVCGLHWHGNMQIILASENASKSNRYWPDMPNTSDPELISLAKTFYEQEQLDQSTESVLP